MYLHMVPTPANMITEGIIQMRLILSFWKGINCLNQAGRQSIIDLSEADSPSEFLSG
jgi:hypothetical protein